MKKAIEQIKLALREEGFEPSEENAIAVYNALRTIAEIVFKREKH